MIHHVSYNLNIRLYSLVSIAEYKVRLYRHYSCVNEERLGLLYAVMCAFHYFVFRLSDEYYPVKIYR